jgi:hypothetical protein
LSAQSDAGLTATGPKLQDPVSIPGYGRIKMVDTMIATTIASTHDDRLDDRYLDFLP